MKLFAAYFLFCVGLMACRNHTANKAMEKYFEKEIADRMSVLSQHPDSLQLSPVKIDREVNNLVLMTKDIENLRTTVIISNNYFRSLAVDHHINPADFSDLSLDMELDEMASLLKQNELNFFNQVIFKVSPDDSLPLYTAH